MNVDEVRRYLSVSRTKSVCVATELSTRYRGFVRSVELQAPSTVLITFEAHGYDEGGARFRGAYPSVEAAVAALEQFLAVPVSDWTSSGDYPALRGERKRGHDAEKLRRDVREQSVRLPAGADFELLDPYWARADP